MDRSTITRWRSLRPRPFRVDRRNRWYYQSASKSSSHKQTRSDFKRWYNHLVTTNTPNMRGQNHRNHWSHRKSVDHHRHFRLRYLTIVCTTNISFPTRQCVIRAPAASFISHVMITIRWSPNRTRDQQCCTKGYFHCSWFSRVLVFRQ